MSEKISLEEQKISLDIYDSSVEKIVEKLIKTARSDELLNKCIERPIATKRFPSMSSVLNVS